MQVKVPHASPGNDDQYPHPCTFHPTLLAVSAMPDMMHPIHGRFRQQEADFHHQLVTHGRCIVILLPEIYLFNLFTLICPFASPPISLLPCRSRRSHMVRVSDMLSPGVCLEDTYAVHEDLFIPLPMHSSVWLPFEDAAVL